MFLLMQRTQNTGFHPASEIVCLTGRKRWSLGDQFWPNCSLVFWFVLSENVDYYCWCFCCWSVRSSAKRSGCHLVFVINCTLTNAFPRVRGLHVWPFFSADDTGFHLVYVTAHWPIHSLGSDVCVCDRFPQLKTLGVTWCHLVYATSHWPVHSLESEVCVCDRFPQLKTQGVTWCM